MIRTAVYILSVFAVLLMAPPAMAEKRVALVIGNSSYKNISKLANPANDARLMAKVLKRQGFEVILGLDLEYRAMKRVIRRYTAKLRGYGPDTVGFLFYAGHGLQVQGVNYLVPVGAEIESEGDVDIETISASSLLFGVRDARNRLNIIVLDACRNNPYRSLFRSGSRGLLQMSAPMGSLIAFSTSPGDVAADGSGGNSPFTKALAKAMQKPGLTIERVFKTARRKVYDVSNKKQLPWINSSVLGDFYPAGQQRKKPRTQTSGADGDRDVAFWQDIRRSKDAADYEDYLQQFPKGTFARRARRLKKKYEKKVAVVVPPSPVAPKPVKKSAIGVFGKQAEDPPNGLQQCWRGWVKVWLGDVAAYKGRGYHIKSRRRGKGKIWCARPNRSQSRVSGLNKVKAGHVFDDCNGAGWCPSMVVVPAGSFMMGSQLGGEKPVHRVTIGKPFAVGRFEVTWDEWEVCVKKGGCVNGPVIKAGGAEGWGKGKRPVINVSWYDAKAYLKWLSRKTEKKYRLLSEAEWEYVARAQSIGRYSWGSGIGQNKANCKGCGSKWDKKKTAPVGSFDPNNFKVHDMHGNVREWVEDCYENSYKSAPIDGSARTIDSCDYRVTRGGSWYYGRSLLFSANRDSMDPRSWGNIVGFRVARSLFSFEIKLQTSSKSNSCITIGRKIPRRIKLTVGTRFCDAGGRNEARVIKIANRAVVFSDNGDRKTCSQGTLCAFDWPVKPLFRIKARADKAKGIAPQATMEPRR